MGSRDVDRRWWGRRSPAATDGGDDGLGAAGGARAPATSWRRCRRRYGIRNAGEGCHPWSRANIGCRCSFQTMCWPGLRRPKLHQGQPTVAFDQPPPHPRFTLLLGGWVVASDAGRWGAGAPKNNDILCWRATMVACLLGSCPRRSSSMPAVGARLGSSPPNAHRPPTEEQGVARRRSALA